MKEDSLPSEGSTHAQASTPVSPAEDHRSKQFEAKRRRRRELQQQCTQPAGLEQESLAASYLFLLDLSEDEVQQRAHQLEQRREVKEQARHSQELPLSSIPLDKHGSQFAADDITESRNSNNGQDSDAHQNDGDWKVVKPKRTKRRKNSGYASTASPPDSPPLNQSTQSFISRDPPSPLSTSDPSSKTSLVPEKLEKQTDQHRFPTLSSRDIEQVAKDVERSFIGPAYSHLSPSSRAIRRRQLTHIILSTLSSHPSLHYFQGYHNILSVILLTLAPLLPSSSSHLFIDDRQQAVLELTAERISLHLIRDSMTQDLLPILGQLKVLGNLLRRSDPKLAELVDRASPLPFFALPWLLTLLTHDAEEIGVGRRVIEWVMALGPRAGIYLCASVLAARREEVLGMDEEELEDPAMLHTILGRLPAIVEEEQADESTDNTTEGKESKVEEASTIYTDPDVELPSLAPDRELAASSAPRIKRDRKQKEGIPISSVLNKAVDLMERYPFDSSDLAADTIMGDKSVLFTWPKLFPSPSSTSLDWAAENASAEAILTGSTDAIVISPHPDPPPPPPGFDDEKYTPLSPRKKQEWEQTRVLAVVGISGLLVAALFTATQNPATSAARMADMGTEETKRVLTLIVSLLSNFGRVVGPGGA